MLDIIEKDHPNDTKGCCARMLQRWLDKTPHASWNHVLKALRSPSVELNYLANQIGQKVKEKCNTPVGGSARKAKSQLNELFLKKNVSDVKYDSRDEGSGDNHNFKSTLSYTFNERHYQYHSRGRFGRKQEAEEDAAQQAFHNFEQQLRQPVSIGSPGHHYKSMLKEKYCDIQQLSPPQYTTKPADGGFVSVVNVPRYGPVKGTVGSNIKVAEQLAAKEAIRKLGL
ncbi:uncharacterized protein [Dysidea avara]